MRPPLPGINNQLISLLSAKTRNTILTQSETVELSFGDVVCEANQTLLFVYFPLTCVISLLMTLEKSEVLEMDLIGNEGMLGAALALGIETTTMQCIVQGSGKSLRLRAAIFRQILAENPASENIFTRYQYGLMEKMMQSAACSYFHTIESRLARWLLMSDDRNFNETLQLTHKFLARMLGVRRSGVTIAAGKLQEKGLIHYSRGQIVILDRHGLEAVSCRCYKNMKIR